MSSGPHRFQNSASALFTRATQSLSRGSSTSRASRSSVALRPITSSLLNPADDDSSRDRRGSSRRESSLLAGREGQEQWNDTDVSYMVMLARSAFTCTAFCFSPRRQHQQLNTVCSTHHESQAKIMPLACHSSFSFCPKAINPLGPGGCTVQPHNDIRCQAWTPSHVQVQFKQCYTPVT